MESGTASIQVTCIFFFRILPFILRLCFFLVLIYGTSSSSGFGVMDLFSIFGYFSHFSEVLGSLCFMTAFSF